MAYNMKEIIIMVSILITCILLIRRIFRKEIGSRLQYALWFLVVLRLVIPVSVTMKTPVSVLTDWYHLLKFSTDDMVEQLEKPIQITIDSRNGIYHLLAEDSTGASDAISGEDGSVIFMVGHLAYSWLDVLGTLWIAGMVLIGVWFFIINVIFGRRLKKERRVMELSGEEEAALRKRLPVKVVRMYDDIRVYIVEGLTSPCIYGLPGREAVYLTPDIVKDTDRLCHVLTHELCHKRHGDSFWGILRGLLVAIYWFHPLVWVAAIVSKRDCELACDETALTLLGEEERISYGETLLSIIDTKARIRDFICTATTMTGSGKSVKERIGFIVKKPKVLRLAVAFTVVLMGVVFIFAFTRTSERLEIIAFRKDMENVTGADMQIPLPESIREVCGQVEERDNDDVVIYHIASKREVGRFARMSLKDALQMVDEGRRVVPLGDYGDNYLLNAYLGMNEGYVMQTMHTYTPAGYGEEASGVNAVPGTDSNTRTEHVYVSGTESNTQTEYVVSEQSNTTQIPAPENTDTYTLFLPYEEGQSLSAEDLVSEENKVDYLPNEKISTTVYPLKEINVDDLPHAGCYVYVKADYDGIEDSYLEQMEQVNRELESVTQEVIVLSFNREIREKLFDALTDNRTPYVGDNSKVGALINALPVPPTLNYTGEFALQTKEEPYSLRFEYEMTQDSFLQDDLDMMYYNAAMLFYAIGNVEEVTFYIKYPIGSDTGPALYAYYREDMKETYGALVDTDYENEALFRERLEELHESVVEHLHAQRKEARMTNLYGD